MKTRDVLRVFGSYAEIARVLGISRQAVQSWGDDVPLLRSYQLREIMDEQGVPVSERTVQ
jgi:hypothetical protein